MTSIGFHYGAKPYTLISHNYHIRKYGTKPYTLISCHYHIRRYGAKPYMPISHNYHTRKLLDTFWACPMISNWERCQVYKRTDFWIFRHFSIVWWCIQIYVHTLCNGVNISLTEYFHFYFCFSRPKLTWPLFLMITCDGTERSQPKYPLMDR